MQDFEALGRYVTAEGEARKFANDRDGILRKAKDLIESSMGGGNSYNSTIAYDFDAAPIQALIIAAIDSHKNLVDAITEANRQADACKKTKTGNPRTLPPLGLKRGATVL